jgi:hypothetical protein
LPDEPEDRAALVSVAHRGMRELRVFLNSQGFSV